MKFTYIKKIQIYCKKIKEIFNVGKVYSKKPNSSKYFVTSIAVLQVIKNHFNNYPLHTQKFGDFELFKQALDLVQNKEHLTLEGFKKIISIRASMNLSLPEKLKTSFPDIMPVNRPIIQSIINYDPYWLVAA